LYLKRHTINTTLKVGYDMGRFETLSDRTFSESRMNSNTQRQRSYTIFAIGLVVVMVFTAVAQSLLPNTQQTTVQPTPTGAPTFPAPPADLSTIVFDQEYLHPSGLYTASYPTGWTTSRPSNNGTQVQVNLENTAMQSIVEVYVDVPVPAITTVEELSARFDDNTLASGWRQYTGGWKETEREVDAATKTVTIDFELEQRQQTYIARHVAQLRDDGWIYVTRVVTPTNASALLFDLIAKAQNVIKPVELFRTTPIAWYGFYSEQDNIIIRTPNNWIVRDGAAGEPVTIESSGQGTLFIDSEDATTVADEEAARAFVLSRRAGAEILSVVPVERNGGGGFAVSFKFRNSEGEPQSGLAVLLNDGENLRTATVRLSNVDVDLNNVTEETLVTVTDAAKMMATFNLTNDLGLPVTLTADEPATEG